MPMAWSSSGVIKICYVLKFTYLPQSWTKFNFLLLKDIILTISKLFANLSKTEEQRNLMINGKNYRNARRRSHCYYGNGERWWRNKYTLMHGQHGCMKAKLI